jgi:hypothetical protein
MLWDGLKCTHRVACMPRAGQQSRNRHACRPTVTQQARTESHACPEQANRTGQRSQRPFMQQSSMAGAWGPSMHSPPCSRRAWRVISSWLQRPWVVVAACSAALRRGGMPHALHTCSRPAHLCCCAIASSSFTRSVPSMSPARESCSSGLMLEHLRRE